MSEPEPKKDDTLKWMNEQAISVGKRYRLRASPKAMFFYGVFMALMAILYWISNITVYFDILLLLSFLYLFLAYADYAASAREKKEKQTAKSN